LTPFSAIPTHTLNICGKFMEIPILNRDMASQVRVNGRTDERTAGRTTSKT